MNRQPDWNKACTKMLRKEHSLLTAGWQQLTLLAKGEYHSPIQLLAWVSPEGHLALNLKMAWKIYTDNQNNRR